jgi:hypothetical protein
LAVLLKIDKSRKAVQFYRWQRSPNGRGCAEVDDDAPVHAVLLEHPKSWKRYKLAPLRQLFAVEYLRRHDEVTAVCGVDVRVVYPMTFDTAEDEVCPACKGLLNVRSVVGEAEFWRQVEEAAHREYQRGLERDRRRADKASALQLVHDLESANAALDEIPEVVDVRNNSTWVFPALHRNEEPGDEADGTA